MIWLLSFLFLLLILALYRASRLAFDRSGFIQISPIPTMLIQRPLVDQYFVNLGTVSISGVVAYMLLQASTVIRLPARTLYN